MVRNVAFVHIIALLWRVFSFVYVPIQRERELNFVFNPSMMAGV